MTPTHQDHPWSRRSAYPLAVGLLLAAVPAMAQPNPGLAPVRLSLLDGEATTYATFQSHNQKVVSNAHGIFTTHIRSRDEPFLAQQWRLSRSTDGGLTFRTIHEATHATNAPALETDARGNLYLGRPDFTDNSAWLYRFTPEDGYSEPTLSNFAGGSAGKYSLTLDAARAQLYWFAWGRWKFTLDLDGNVLDQQLLTRSGEHAVPQYPLSVLDPGGTLHTAWTTQKHDVYLYWDIHYMASDDGGRSWRKMDGTPLTVPMPVDDSGPSDRVTLDDEFEVHSWLANVYVRDGKAHFAYSAQGSPWRQHYVRYDLSSARRDVDIFPEFRGTAIQVASLDGFFASRSDVPGATIYYVSSAFGQLGCLASDDGGQSWYDYALSQERFNLYSIGGARELTADGALIGTFTDQRATAERDSSQVWFFRIQAGLSRALLQGLHIENGLLRAQFSGVRGQPEHVRFGNRSDWGPWLEFAEDLEASAAAALPAAAGPPSRYQLRSRLGVESQIFELDQATAVTGASAATVPATVHLAPGYPNPFNGGTVIKFHLPRAARCELALYDSAGRRVRTLLAAPLAAGSHAVRWDGASDDGAQMASGVYFSRLSADGQVRTGRLALVR